MANEVESPQESTDSQGRSTELVIGIIISLIILAVAVYWMYSASVGAVPFVLAFGLPNNLVVNLVVLVILAVVVWFVFNSVKKSKS